MRRFLSFVLLLSGVGFLAVVLLIGVLTIVGGSEGGYLVQDHRMIAFVFVILLASTVFFAVHGISYINSLVKGQKQASARVASGVRTENHQVDALVSAFRKLAEQVESRNNGLLEELEYAALENESKNNFLMSISHELRTPMHAILNLAEMGKAKADTMEREKVRHFFSRIEESGERLLRLINGLLDFTRLEAGEAVFNYTYHNIVECASAVFEELKPISDQKGVKLQLDYTDNNITGFFDYDRIFQVLINIISNAIKFSPESAVVEVTLSLEVEKLQGDNAEKCIKVVVSDDGVGIPDDETEVIFKKFTQGRHMKPGNGGSGLGLAICHEIISYHHGKIWAENKKDKGTKILFLLPVERQETDT